ncbi:MAG: GNAT family N-acetyltransferase [Arhodomonas sp.]|nr:GNAT family N-acetyltransferase [Arhodomonas sp.]
MPASALAADERALRGLFGLLVDAHYQTRPEDLRRMLEAPEAAVWRIVDSAGHTIAAALTLEVGRAAAGPPGRDTPRRTAASEATSSPSRCAAHAGLADATSLRHRRVHRLAVHPDLQRRGLGRRLLTAITEAAAADGLDTAGTVFGATPELLAFWRSAGFEPIHLGHRRDAASGTRAAFMLRPCSAAGRALTSFGTTAFADDLPWRLAGPLRDLPAALVAALLQGLPFPPPTGRDRAIATAFAHGHRGADDAGAAIQRLLLPAGSGGLPEALAPTDRALLIGRFLQHQSWATLAAEASASGRRQVTDRLRRAMATLLAVAPQRDRRCSPSPFPGERTPVKIPGEHETQGKTGAACMHYLLRRVCPPARYAAYILSLAGLAVSVPAWLLGVWWIWPAALVFAALSALGTRDILQRRHTVSRNYPILAHLRYGLESIGPEIRQYFIESDTEERPFSRQQRAVVYQRAKQVHDKKPFGNAARCLCRGLRVDRARHWRPAPVSDPDFRVTVGADADAAVFRERAERIGHELRRPLRQRHHAP